MIFDLRENPSYANVSGTHYSRNSGKDCNNNCTGLTALIILYAKLKERERERERADIRSRGSKWSPDLPDTWPYEP